MNDCLVDLRDLLCIPNLDGILYHGKMFDEHLENLRMGLRQHGVKLRAKKCLFFKNKVKHLGKIISERQYRTIQLGLKQSKTKTI